MADTVPMGTVFDIQKFSIHDGPGIRTTVFLKGCPLRCAWCHNPESQESAPEISFVPEKCIGCMACVRACPSGCHVVDTGGHVYARDRCERCGACTVECYARALELIGEKMSVAGVLEEVLKDKPFYETSGGGMTISGGEPLAQYAFTKELLSRAKQEDLHTCLETCGYADFERLHALIGLVDLFLYDVKDVDPQKHRDFVGADNVKILSNLKHLGDTDADIVLRCPIVPGYNDRNDHFDGVADLAQRTNGVREVHVLPYHPLGKSKSDRIGKTYGLGELSFVDDDQVELWMNRIRAGTDKPVRRS